MALRQHVLAAAVQWGAAALNAVACLTPVKRRFDLPYGPGPRRRLDLYQPIWGRRSPQTIIFFYGGGWTSGSRRTYRFVGAALAMRGFRVIIPDYRLYPHASLDEIMRDAADAVSWAATRYPAQGLFLSGHSVGAYIAVTLAASRSALPQGTPIQGVIGIAGPYLPLREATAPPLPPALLIAAEDDRLVPATKTRQFAAQWQAAGPVKVRLYRRGGHALLVGAISPVLQWAVPVLRDLLCFTRSVSPQVRDAD